MAKKLKPEKLEVGAGKRRNNDTGWTYNDVQKIEGIDIVCDIRDLLEHVEEGCVRQLRACHVLEHFPTNEIDKVVGIFNKLMEQDGQIYIEVPNFQAHANLVMQGRDEEAVLYAFGGHLDEYDRHLTGFTPKILKRVLEMNGFTGVQIRPLSEQNTGTMVATAFKK